MMRLKIFFLLLLCSLQVLAQSNAKQTARITRQYNNVSFSQALKDLDAQQSKLQGDEEHPKPERARCHHAAHRFLSHQDDTDSKFN